MTQRKTKSAQRIRKKIVEKIILLFSKNWSYYYLGIYNKFKDKN